MIPTDNGLEFQNEQMRNLCQEWNFEWGFSSPDHHRTVGAIEKANQILMNIIRKLSNFGNESWDKIFYKATFVQNISFNRAIITSPYILIKLKVPKFEIDM